MHKESDVQKLTEIMSKFIGVVSYRLPDDVESKLKELREEETGELAKIIYTTMDENQKLAYQMKRPSCQDTGVLQFFVKCGEHFPLMGQLNTILREATYKSTMETPLRHNSVETFDEYNTKKNIGTGTPSIFWEIEPDSDGVEIYTYMAGGGCSLPGVATVLMPGEGYEAIVKLVLDRMTSYGLNACPPLLVGVGVGTSVETAAMNSKLALMRTVDSKNENTNAAKLEQLLEDGINAIGLGPQGLKGLKSVLGVNVVNTARHPSTIGVAVNTGCWSHRRGLIIFDKDLNFSMPMHKGEVL